MQLTLFVFPDDPAGVVDTSGMSGGDGLGESSDHELATAAAAVENDKGVLQEAITSTPGGIQ